MEQELRSHLSQVYETVFARKGERLFFSPGRVNLIGEHTDYNGGHVFPCAITNGTYGLVALRNDQIVRVYSENFKEVGVIEFDLDQLSYDKAHLWANFVKGMLNFIKQAGYPITKGFDLLVYGNIPNGAGLSSSASLEMLVGVLVNDLFDLKIDRIDLIKLGQQVENHYIGVNSGIMDQFAIGMGAEDMAIYLDTNHLTYDLVPADFGSYKLLIMNTNKRRELADSKYNTRRQECETALQRLQTVVDIQSLGELTATSFENHRHVINDAVLEARAKHAIYENERTQAAKMQLTAGRIDEFGKLMNASHVSLRDDYEVTGIELDTLVEAAWAYPAVLGARMTGAGMGGCAIALVHQDEIEAVQAGIREAYLAKIGYEPSFYVAAIGPGTKELAYNAESKD